MLNSDVENLQHVTISIFMIIQNLMRREFDTTIDIPHNLSLKINWYHNEKHHEKSINGDKHKSIPLIS
jgi:hypothetical protein